MPHNYLRSWQIENKIENKTEQLVLINKEELRHIKSWSFGGELLKKRRKTARPLVPKKKIHVVFKSHFSTGKYSMLAHKQFVLLLLNERAKKYFITIHDVVNMGNHLHLKISGNDLIKIKNFLRTFAAILARKITNAHRSNPFGKFWKGLVFTRVLHSSFEELGLKGYFEGNREEREFGKQNREIFLHNFNLFLRRLKKVRAVPKAQADLWLSLE